MIKFVFLGLFLSSIAMSQEHPVDVTAIRFNVEKYKLPNGLTVLLQPDHSVPLVSYQTYFRVGSGDEVSGSTGLAHLFEHMMFKGAKRYQDKELDHVLHKVGATYNAFTTNDLTAFYIDLPSSRLELATDIESDRMQNLVISEENLRSELEVVKEERRYRYDNNVHGSLFETMFGTVFTKSSYRWPVIGYMEDLNHMTVEKCRKFFKQFYAPNNAIVIVVGDFDIEITKKLIDKYYGLIPSQTIDRPDKVKEPVIAERRAKSLTKDVAGDVFALTFLSVPIGNEDGYALDLVGDLLSEGASSRLYKKLVRDSRLVDSISASNYGLKDEGLFIISASLKAGGMNRERDDVIKKIEGELWQLRNRLVTVRELEKSKARMMKQYVDGLKQLNDRGHLLGQGEVYYGDYSRVFDELKKYNAITPEQIRQAANRYLDLRHSALITITKAQKSTQVQCSSRGGKC